MSSVGNMNSAKPHHVANWGELINMRDRKQALKLGEG